MSMHARERSSDSDNSELVNKHHKIGTGRYRVCVHLNVGVGQGVERGHAKRVGCLYTFTFERGILV